MTKSAWVRVLPFAVFMLFIAVQQSGQWIIDKGYGALTETHLLFLYPIKVVVVGILLLYLFRFYSEINVKDLFHFKHTFLGLFVGVLVFILWINMDWSFATFGDSQGFNPTLIEQTSVRNFLIIMRIIGAALLVPVMEELFWRSFLLRYIIDNDFERVKIGTYTLASFAIGAVLFGLEHNLVLAGIVAGALYSLLLYKTKSLTQCIIAHGVTNLLLGIYVLLTQNWQFW